MARKHDTFNWAKLKRVADSMTDQQISDALQLAENATRRINADKLQNKTNDWLADNAPDISPIRSLPSQSIYKS